MTEVASIGATAPPAFRYVYVIACSGNTAANPANTLCGLAATGCPDGALMRWYERVPIDATGADTGPGQVVSSQCASDAQVAAAASAPAFPGVSEADFRRLPLPPGVAHVEPNTGYVLINVPTNVYAIATTTILPATVLGTAVRVRATPQTYAWSFGDGATIGPTSDPGAPYPQLRLVHTYTSAVRAAITLTTTYTGEYSVAGGPWLPIDGTASVASAPVPVSVLSGRSALVADPLSSDVPSG